MLKLSLLLEDDTSDRIRFDYDRPLPGIQGDPNPDVLVFGWWNHPTTRNILLCGLNLNKMNAVEKIMIRSIIKGARAFDNAKDIYWYLRDGYNTLLSHRPAWVDNIVDSYMKMGSSSEPGDIFAPYQHGGAYATWRKDRIGSITKDLFTYAGPEEFIKTEPETPPEGRPPEGEKSSDQPDIEKSKGDRIQTTGAGVKPIGRVEPFMPGYDDAMDYDDVGIPDRSPFDRIGDDDYVAQPESKISEIEPDKSVEELIGDSTWEKDAKKQGQLSQPVHNPANAQMAPTPDERRPPEPVQGSVNNANTAQEIDKLTPSARRRRGKAVGPLGSIRNKLKDSDKFNG